MSHTHISYSHQNKVTKELYGKTKKKHFMFIFKFEHVVFFLSFIIKKKCQKLYCVSDVHNVFLKK
jgi:hypothetical protein